MPGAVAVPVTLAITQALTTAARRESNSMEHNNALIEAELSESGTINPMIDSNLVGQLLSQVGMSQFPLFEELIEEFILDAHKQVPELTEKLAAGDHDRLSRIAHRLRGAAAGVGALQLSHYAGRIEDTFRSAQTVQDRDVASLIAAIGPTAAAFRDKLNALRPK